MSDTMHQTSQESPISKNLSFELKWYYILVSTLVILSFVTLNRNIAGKWELTLGLRETTSILVTLAILPILLKFLVKEIPPGTKVSLDMLNKLFGLTVDREQEIDKKISQNQDEHEKAGEAAKEEKEIESYIRKSQNADTDLKKTVTPQELPFVQQIYKQKLIGLVQDFNRNRHYREKGKNSMVEGDRIVYEMRSMAPLLFGQLDISAWLNSPNLGKQLAAIKYLDWSQDIEFAEALANRLRDLEKSGDTFQAYHVLLALYSMANQLSYDHKDKVRMLLNRYTPSGSGNSSRSYIKERILLLLS